MKKYLLIGLLMLASLTWIAWPKSARCAWCPPYRCYSSCGHGCVCVTPPGEFSGYCYGIERVPGAK